MLLAACSSTENKPTEESTQKQPVYEKPKALIAQSKLDLLNIKWVSLTQRMIYPTIYANGVVAPKPNHDAAVVARITGVIDKIFVLEGVNVQKGQALMSISSTELIQLQQDYMSALADANFYRKEFERQTTLRNSNVGALSEYQLIESKYQNAISLEKTLREKLRLQGIDPNDLADPENAKIKTEKILRSPISGFIHNMPARVGMRPEPGTVLAEIIDLSELRADVYCYEKDLALIQEKQPIEIQFANKAIPAVKGNIEFVSRTIDKETRAIIMHTSFKAPKGYLVLPEMSITAKIQGLNFGKSKKVIPHTAIYDDGSQSYVYYTTSPDTAKVKEVYKGKVRLGVTDGEFVEIDFEEPVPDNAKFANTNVANIEGEFGKKSN